MNKTKRLLISMLTLLCCCTGMWAVGELNGVFTISASGGKVQFSQGNLQYQASTNTWRFATNQYDYIGNAAGNTSPSSTQTAWIDYFNWGTSGYNHGANCYQPWSTSTTRSDYYAYGSSSKNLYDAKDDNSMRGQADWGYNAISNGGNTENSGWRVLTKDEWAYLISSRSETYRYAKGTIHGTNGLMLFPDGFTLPTGVSISNANTTDASYTSYGDDTWTALEAAGVVFLPATGLRNGTSVQETGTVGNYWSSTCMNADRVYNIRFDGSSLNLGNDGDRQNGFPVRLVKSYLKQDGEGNYLIGSADDWKAFADIVKMTQNANAKMTADVNLGSNQSHIGSMEEGGYAFSGTFDGQGHTLTVAYVGSASQLVSPFSKISGATIKNLHVDGTIQSTFAYVGVVGFVSGGTVNISNVWMSGDFSTTFGQADLAAFVGGSSGYANVTISDCLYTGSMSSSGSYSGCFVGYIHNGSVTMNNCLATGSYNYTYPGLPGTYNNCYIKNFTGVDSYPSGATNPTDAELSNGTTAAALGSAWVQDAVSGEPRLDLFMTTTSLTAHEGATGEYWATYYNGVKSFVADANTTVYQASVNSSKTGVVLTEVTGREIPAGKGVVLKSTSTTIMLTPATTTQTLDGNELQGSDVDLATPTNAYCLSKETTRDGGLTPRGVGFYTYTSATIPAHRAYLVVEGGPNPARGFLGFGDDDNTTGISLPEAVIVETDGPIYDLSGRRVTGQPHKGIYVKDGKKFVIK